MHACCSIRWKYSDVLMDCLNKPEPTLFQPQLFNLNSIEDPLMPCALCFSLHMITSMSMVMSQNECMLARPRVDMCAYAAAALMRDRGSQGFRCWCVERGGEWHGSWIVMVDSCSLTKRLSVTLQSETAALPPCLLALSHKHTHKNTQARAGICRSHARIHTHSSSSYPLHLGPLRPLSHGDQSCLPPWQHEHSVLITYVCTTLTPGKTLNEYGITCRM